MTADDFALNNYTTLRNIGMNPERAAYYGAQWGIDRVAVVGHAFDDGKLRVSLQPLDERPPYQLELDL